LSNIITSIQLKRGEKTALNQVLVGTKKPLKGEPVWETDTNRMKIGDGINNYIDLPYFGGEVNDQLVIEGYYDSVTQSFYDKPLDDPTKQKLTEWLTKLYKDLPTGNVYYFKAIGRFTILNTNVKLYTIHGQNTDGAMTQKAVTDAIDEINFTMNEEDSECLVLNKPW